MWLAALALVLIAAPPAVPTGAATSLQVLKARFGDQIKLTASPVTQLKYCPDNTCDIFRTRDAKARVQLTDFALLYLWYLSQYSDLQVWQRGIPPATVGVVRERYSASCDGAGERARAKCALVALSKLGSIELAFSRWDEGADNEGPVDLLDELKRLE
jgi:hypothetical protein